MEQHPIPQQISSYQFRLVGDMTLKQFFQLAGGALIALLFYATPLPTLIKWPLMIFFGLLGVALAFVPLEERPLSRWIVTFLKSVYSPTLFNWEKTKIAPVFFQEEGQAPMVTLPPSQQATENYLAQTTVKNPLFEQLESTEKTFLSGLSTLFGPGSPQTGQITINQPAQAIEQPKIQEMTIPQIDSIKVVGSTPRPKIVVEENVPPKPFETFTPLAPAASPQGFVPARGAQFSAEAAPPTPSTQPNIVVGQVLDEQGKIVEGAIMEIRDIAGRPVRALKSNKLGHFMIVTPLSNGRYEIITDKEGFTFEPISFEATGELLSPIAIRAQSRPQLSVSEIQPTVGNQITT